MIARFEYFIFPDLLVQSMIAEALRSNLASSFLLLQLSIVFFTETFVEALEPTGYLPNVTLPGRRRQIMLQGLGWYEKQLVAFTSYCTLHEKGYGWEPHRTILDVPKKKHTLDYCIRKRNGRWRWMIARTEKQGTRPLTFIGS
jgi:hypothetical protein